jgi:hypothetical protein
VSCLGEAPCPSVDKVVSIANERPCPLARIHIYWQARIVSVDRWGVMSWRSVVHVDERGHVHRWMRVVCASRRGMYTSDTSASEIVSVDRRGFYASVVMDRRTLEKRHIHWWMRAVSADERGQYLMVGISCVSR